jgi:hypothetical protein
MIIHFPAQYHQRSIPLMNIIKFYTKPECPLCDEVREILETSACEWQECNIYLNSEWLDLFRTEIPVLQCGGQTWFYRDREKVPLLEWLNKL